MYDFKICMPYMQPLYWTVCNYSICTVLSYYHRICIYIALLLYVCIIMYNFIIVFKQIVQCQGIDRVCQ